MCAELGMTVTADTRRRGDREEAHYSCGEGRAALTASDSKARGGLAGWLSAPVCLARLIELTQWRSGYWLVAINSKDLSH